jgi:site-specific DNA-methyltransferase (adenine-specific)
MEGGLNGMNLLNTIIHGDCFKILPQIPSNSVDLILIDPPYNILEHFTWDHIPINLVMMWNEFHRILTEHGVVAVFCAEPFTSKLILSNEPDFQYKWVWKKVRGSNFMQSHKRPQNNYEEIAVFYSTTNPIYNPQMKERTETGKKRVERAKLSNKAEIRNTSNVSVKLNPKTIMFNNVNKLDIELKYPTLVIDTINEINSCALEKTDHPTQKPITIYEYFIQTYTNPKMMVLDCFAGSGVNAIACLNLKRNYCCIEQDSKYMKIILHRIKAYNPSIQFKKEIHSDMTIYYPLNYFQTIGVLL